MALESGQTLGAQEQGGAAVFSGKLREEKFRQRRNALAARAQRRHFQREDFDAEEQVFAETPGLHFREQGFVCRRDEASGEPICGRAAQSGKLSAFQESKQLGLECDGFV